MKLGTFCHIDFSFNGMHQLAKYRPTVLSMAAAEI